MVIMAKPKNKTNRKAQSFIQFGLVAGIIIFVNVLANQFYGHIDLTEDKRYSLTPASKDLIKNLDDYVTFEVFLDGEFPAAFARLQNSLRDLLVDFRSMNKRVDFQFTDPNAGTVEQINMARENLAKRGIFPINLQIKGGDEYSEKLIYPGVIVRYRGRELPVNILENNSPGTPQDIVLNNSASLLEYKMTNAISKLQTIRQPKIALLTGHGELQSFETASLEFKLDQFYELARLNLDSVVTISDKIDLLLIAKPTTNFSERDKFKIDQYVMNGGKSIWLVDRLTTSMDSLRNRAGAEYIPIDYPLNIEDLLFRYGVRINPNIVLDMQCSKLPLQVGMMGAQPQFDLRPWVYFPVVLPDYETDHPIVKSLDAIDFKFANTIDTVKTKTAIEKTILLSSSKYTRLQFSPFRLGLEIARTPPTPEKYNKGAQPLAVLLEGEFPSLYENRVSESMTSGLEELGLAYKPLSSPTKILVVSDGDIARNNFDFQKNQPSELGFNQYERYTFANADFLLNAVEYMMDDNGIIASRSKEIKLRLLNKAKLIQETSFLGIPLRVKTKWQIINVTLPLLLLLIFGWTYQKVRKRRYAEQVKAA